MEFARVGALIAAGGASPTAPFLFGIGMILTGVGFKLGVAPFHMWTPDVYEGAPAPVTAFVATVSKGAMFALLFRNFLEGSVYAFPSARLAIAAVAVVSMLAGIPLTAGFVGKFYILAAGVRSGIWVPVAVLVASSAIGLFYYLRIIVAMYSRAPEVTGKSTSSLRSPLRKESSWPV